MDPLQVREAVLANPGRIQELLALLDASPGAYTDPSSRESIVWELIARALVEIADRPQ